MTKAQLNILVMVADDLDKTMAEIGDLPVHGDIS